MVAALNAYIARKGALSDTDALLITHRKPHRPAHRDTIARWLKDALKLAGIHNFTAHSYRAAGTCRVVSLTLTVKDIMEQGQWTSESTWSKYYDKEIIYRASKNNFASVLQSTCN